MGKLGFSNIQDYIEKGNKVVDLSQIPRDQAAAVSSIEVSYDSKGRKQVKFKIADKRTALAEFLDRVKGKPKQTTEIKGVIGTRELTEKELKHYVTNESLVDCEQAIAG